MPKLITAGEFYFDLIFHQLPRLPRLGEELKTDKFALALGGGAPITAVTVAKLGRQVELASVVGDTALDAHALQELKSQKVGIRHVKQQPRMMGALAVAVSVRRDRYFLTYPGANRALEPYLLSARVRKWLEGARHVHFGLSPRRWAPYARLVRRLRRQGVTSSWDLGWNPDTVRQPGFRRLYGLLDVVFYNQDEALYYSRTTSLEQALARLARSNQTLVVKLGSKGAVAVGPDGRRYRAPAFKVKSVDTTGAGDAFNGGFLHAWLDDADLPHCLRVGNITGALSSRVPGGSDGTPTKAELKRLLRQRP